MTDPAAVSVIATARSQSGWRSAEDRMKARDVETADQGCLPVGLPSVHSRPLQALEREEEAGCNQGRKMETRSRVSRSAFPNETGHPDPRREEGAALFDLVDVPHA
ncbi:hypothetical protein ACWGJX_42415 [Streptomyces sp. NPDC054775]